MPVWAVLGPPQRFSTHPGGGCLVTLLSLRRGAPRSDTAAGSAANRSGSLQPSFIDQPRHTPILQSRHAASAMRRLQFLDVKADIFALHFHPRVPEEPTVFVLPRR